MFRIEATPINPPGSIGYDPRRRSLQFASAERAKQVFDKWTADGWNVYRYGPINGAPPSRGSFDNKPCIWFDSGADLELYGWRFAGFADEIVGRGIDHRGWFTTEPYDSGEVYRGAVVLLPHGIACPAVYNSCNDGIAVFASSQLWEHATNPDDNATRSHHDTAARYADSVAEHAAERERDYQEKWRRAANLADRLAELTKLGQFADGSRLNPWNESERLTLLSLEKLQGQLQSPEFALTPSRHAYWARLSASGYDCKTAWIGPYNTIAECAIALVEHFGDHANDLDDLDLIDDPECAEHFPHPRADELLAAETHRQSIRYLGRHFIGYRDGANGLEVVRGDDGASFYLQPCSDDLREFESQLTQRGIDAVAADYFTN